MIGARRRSCSGSDPIFNTLTPGKGMRFPNAGTGRIKGTAGRAICTLRAQRRGTVKMVHNGIEYGLMAACTRKGSGFSSRQHWQAEARGGCGDDAAARRSITSTTSISATWRRSGGGERNRLVAAGSDFAGSGEGPAAWRSLRGCRIRVKGGGRSRRRDRRGGAGRWCFGGAVRTVQFTRRGGLSEQDPVGDAVLLQRARRRVRQAQAQRRRGHREIRDNRRRSRTGRVGLSYFL